MCGRYQNALDPAELAELYRIQQEAILTTGPNADLAGVHDRMPVILRPDEEDAWLAPDADPAAFLKPAPDGTLVAVEANRALNSREAEGPGVVEADWSRG